MSAKHHYLRRGGNRLIGVENDIVRWKLTANGWEKGDEQLETVSVLGGIEAESLADFEKVGPMVNITLAPLMGQPVTGGTHVYLAAGSIPERMLPDSWCCFPVMVQNNTNTVPAIARAETNGVVSFFTPDVNGIFAAYTPTNQFGWPSIIGMFHD